ncbi:MAG: transaldolase [Phycisphaerales bacterium]|nr:transaldolase [Phycisphaerales bacterium]
MSMASLIATGTKVWLDGVAPGDVERVRAWGVSGATSNPTIVAQIIEKGSLDGRILQLIREGGSDDQIAWSLDDELVTRAQEAFLPVWERTEGDDGFVSFELDPLIEEPSRLSHAERVQQYIDLGNRWSAGQRNRMIKVPATQAGIDALETLAAAGVTINVTLMFTQRQYRLARDAIWRGAQRRDNGLDGFKSVYSIFVSRVDAYTAANVPALSRAAQGTVGLVNAKRTWRDNEDFWKDKGLRLRQEIVFASTGVKNASDPPDKYVRECAGGGIETNPLATNEAVEASTRPYTREVDRMPVAPVLAEIDDKVNMMALENHLMAEGTRKFADAQRRTHSLIAQKRLHTPGTEYHPSSAEQ